MNTYDFTPNTITVNGKTFPAAYSITRLDAVQIAVTVDDDGRPDTVLIEIENDGSRDYKAARLAATHQEQPTETAPIPQEERRPDICAEEPTESKEDEAMKPITAPAAVAICTAEKTEEKEHETMNATATIEAQQPAPVILQQEEPQEAPAPVTEAAQEERREDICTEAAADPKAAHGPIPEKDFAGQMIHGNGWAIVFDEWNQRTRVVCTEAVMGTARPIIEAAGFYYSRPLNSWNKKLTHRAHRAALALADQLRAALA